MFFLTEGVPLFVDNGISIMTCSVVTCSECMWGKLGERWVVVGGKVLALVSCAQRYKYTYIHTYVSMHFFVSAFASSASQGNQNKANEM